jgi:DNA-binding MarR family transcriptional regulator
MPDDAFVKSVKGLPARMASRLAFMSRDHHTVRDFVVRELPRQDRPLSPSQIAAVIGLTLQSVSAILTELERNLFFLVRDREGNVSWAFPVTTSQTPHRLTFSTGETIFGA